MMDTAVVASKLAAGVIGAAAFYVCRRLLAGRPADWRRFVTVAAAAWVLLRVGVFLALVVFNVPVPTDVPTYYVPQARLALSGHLVYRDFPSSYGPLFPYLGAALLWSWDSPRVFVLFALLVELSYIALWAHVARRTVGEQPMREGVLLYLCNPIALVNVAAVGQNQIWLGALWGAAALFVVRGRSFTSGVLTSLSAAAVKFLGFLPGPVFWLHASRRRSFALGMVLGVLLCFGPFATVGMGLLQPFRAEAGQMTSGNLIYLATLARGATSLTVGHVADLLTACALGATLWWLRPRREEERGRYVLEATSVLVLALMLFSKKSYTFYLTAILLPLLIALVRASARRGFDPVPWIFGWSTAAALEPTIWFHWLKGQASGLPDFGAATGAGAWARLGAFLAIEIVLVGGYVAWILVLARGRSPATLARPARQ